jgi:hypothetical protein
MWLNAFEAPDLSGFHGPIVNQYWMSVLFHRAGSDDDVARAYVHNLIHATDKAIREYNAGRATLLEYAGSRDRAALLIEGLGRFETCINSAKRALRFVDRLAAHPVGPEVDRAVRHLLESYGHCLTPLRDAIEHMDNFVVSGELPPGANQILGVDHDGRYLEIADHRLPFHDLANLLRRLHSLASECARFREPTTAGVRED